VFLLTSAESVVLLGLVVPGEITAVLGGVLAAEGHAPLSAVLAAAIAGPWAGDAGGFAIGRRFGEGRHRRRRNKSWRRATQWLAREGGIAVFLGRFTPFLRSVIPSAAGAAKMPWRRFLRSSLPAGAIWGAASTLAGYFGARDFEKVSTAIGRVGIALLIAVLIAAIVFGKHLLARRADRS
jgi:membrane protein DedA with SNARE-associated domain